MSFDADTRPHAVLIIPGVGEGVPETSPIFIRHWNRYGLMPVVHRMKWRDSDSFESKFTKLLARIDGLARNGPIAIIGCSAGGSAAINALAARPEAIARVATVCGWLRIGPYTARLTRLRNVSSSFVDSVYVADRHISEAIIKNRTPDILAMHAVYDELVPKEVSILPEAINTTIYIPEHNLAIGVALTLYARTIANFLNKGHA